MRTQRTVVAGWGRTTPVATDLARPDLVDDLSEIVAGSSRMIPRGLGRSYGDSAQLAGGTTLDLSGLDRILGFDETTGIVDVEAGVSLDHLIRVLTPQGWFVPVSPGTRYVTVGGAIASDIHGKNHHSAGTFSTHVVEFQLVKANGEVEWIRPGTNPEIFWATAGGMGLTGVIARARVQMRPVETARIKGTTYRATNLDDLMAQMVEIDQRSPYTVAWVDCLTKGAKFGRGLISAGDHATKQDLSIMADPTDVAIGQQFSVPIDFPTGILNRLSVRAFNELWFQKAPRKPVPQLETFANFFHPLDMIGDWNRIYGRHGFIQYQFVVPDSAAQLVGEAIHAINRVGGASFLTILKRFGAANPGYLSFPTEGWTLTLDIPAQTAGLAAELDRFDRRVAAAGGRVYLTKDARLAADTFAQMYPRLDEWRAIRDSLDPEGKFTSDMATRLGLTR